MNIQEIIDALELLKASVGAEQVVAICFDDYVVDVSDIRLTTSEDYDIEEGVPAIFAFS